MNFSLCLDEYWFLFLAGWKAAFHHEGKPLLSHHRWAWRCALVVIFKWLCSDKNHFQLKLLICLIVTMDVYCCILESYGRIVIFLSALCKVVTKVLKCLRVVTSTVWAYWWWIMLIWRHCKTGLSQLRFVIFWEHYFPVLLLPRVLDLLVSYAWIKTARLGLNRLMFLAYWKWLLLETL